MTEIERRICWRCLLVALIPFLLLAAVAWFAITQAQAGRRTAALEADALLEELTDLESSNASLRAELGSARDELSAARAALVAGGGEGDAESLIARLKALPEAERAALFSTAAIKADPNTLTARVAELDDRDRASFFDTLAGLPTFSAWFGGLDEGARRNWLRQLPGGDALGDAGAAAERMELLRSEARKAEDERDALRQERDELAASVETLQQENDELNETLDRAQAPTAAMLTRRLGALEPAEQSVFFGSLPRSGLFSDWLQRATIEEREAFAAAAPESFRRAISGLDLPGEGWVSADEIKRRLADTPTASIQAAPAGAGAAATITAPGHGEITAEEATALILKLEQDARTARATARSEASGEIERLRAAEADLRAQLEDAEAALAQERARASSQGADAAESQAAVQAAQSRADGVAEELAAAQGALDQATRELERTTQRLDQQSKELAAKNQELTRKDEEIAKLREASQETDRDAALNEGIEQRIAGRLDQPGAAAAPAEVGARTALQLSSSLAFETASATLSDAGKQALDNIAAELLAELAVRPDRGWRLMIEGHTDKRPINTEQFPSNWTLSAARAAAVADYLADQGVPPERIYAIGRAEFDPEEQGETEAVFAKNRRIEFDIIGE